MAVRSVGWIGSRQSGGVVVEAQPKSQVLTLQQRRARLHRRRRLSQAQVALEGALWVAGTLAVSVIAFAGIYGLR